MFLWSSDEFIKSFNVPLFGLLILIKKLAKTVMPVQNKYGRYLKIA